MCRYFGGKTEVVSVLVPIPIPILVPIPISVSIPMIPWHGEKREDKTRERRDGEEGGDRNV